MAALVDTYKQLVDPQYRHFAPYALHPAAKFEGFYTKFTLPTQAILIIIICSVPNAPAKNHKHNVNLTYIPAPDAHEPVWQREIFPEEIRASSTADTFILSAMQSGREIAAMHASPTHVRHTIALADGTVFTADSHTAHASATRWSAATPSPESWLRWMPLPLHWHVHSLSAPAPFALRLPDVTLPDAARAGEARVHLEKNWSNGFPAAHVWLLARDERAGSTVSLAGGRTLGLDAFLVGVRLPQRGIAVDFRPPFALRLPFFAVRPRADFLAFDVDWPSRNLHLAVRDLRWRVEIDATAPRAAFFEFSAPTPDGLAPGAMAETMRARVAVRVYRRIGAALAWAVVPFAGSLGWTLVAEESFENAGLEFGGAYYTARKDE